MRELLSSYVLWNWMCYASQETNTESAPTSHDIVTLEGSRVMMRNVEGQQSVQNPGKERLLYATY
ncbi:hypothetical protein H9L39_00388 [Fusarium oxysporum f. sp. albedinis]|nr:hypothetical protein H9L39_00388 [Fusarium oxysporum f. sp. albedinis]